MAAIDSWLRLVFIHHKQLHNAPRISSPHSYACISINAAATFRTGVTEFGDGIFIIYFFCRSKSPPSGCYEQHGHVWCKNEFFFHQPNLCATAAAHVYYYLLCYLPNETVFMFKTRRQSDVVLIIIYMHVFVFVFPVHSAFMLIDTAMPQCVVVRTERTQHTRPTAIPRKTIF